ncbi:MAG: 50S ribosomal protein L13 [Patescibacteria group bacterium]
MEYNLDATNEKLGRLATKVAVLLMGKNKPNFVKNEIADSKVVVSNASKMDISDKKMEQKGYNKYSGYPGGRRVIMMNRLVAQKGYSEALKKAVRGMLPSNKLRSKMLNNLKISE